MRNILVSAYACEPLKGSEQGVGWNWVIQLAKNNQVHVITRANNRAIIEQNFPVELSDNLFFYYYDTPKYILRLKKKAKGLYLYYFMWQIGVLSQAKKLKKQIDFDYTFQPTLGSIWMPTFLPFLNIPFIWGPLGGGEGVPQSFLKVLPLKDRLIQSFRYLLKYSIYLNPLLIYSLYKSKIILIRTKNTLEFIPPFFRNKCKLILETSMEESVFNYKRIDTYNEEIKLIMTGRLVPFKNTLSVIKALEIIPENYRFNLTIIGSGPEKEKLQKAIGNKSFKDKVTIIDELTRQDVMEHLCRSDIYLFPSLREGGSWALMEAMAIGLPVICLNWTGNEIITDESSAIRLEVTSPELLPHEIARSICNLVDNPTLKSQIGQHARERIKKEFNWDVKGKFLAALFTEISN